MAKAPIQAAPEPDLEDLPADPAAVSEAPPRPHDVLVGMLDTKWSELKTFVAELEGEIEGELGDVLVFVRAKL